MSCSEECRTKARNLSFQLQPLQADNVRKQLNFDALPSPRRSASPPAQKPLDRYENFKRVTRSMVPQPNIPEPTAQPMPMNAWMGSPGMTQLPRDFCPGSPARQISPTRMPQKPIMPMSSPISPIQTYSPRRQSFGSPYATLPNRTETTTTTFMQSPGASYQRSPCPRAQSPRPATPIQCGVGERPSQIINSTTKTRRGNQETVTKEVQEIFDRSQSMAANRKPCAGKTLDVSPMDPSRQVQFSRRCPAMSPPRCPAMPPPRCPAKTPPSCPVVTATRLPAMPPPRCPAKPMPAPRCPGTVGETSSVTTTTTTSEIFETTKLPQSPPSGRVSYFDTRPYNNRRSSGTCPASPRPHSPTYPSYCFPRAPTCPSKNTISNAPPCNANSGGVGNSNPAPAETYTQEQISIFGSTEDMIKISQTAYDKAQALSANYSVTPVNSEPSFCPGSDNYNMDQNTNAVKDEVNRCIEEELDNREQEERQQLERDLRRWQEARRRLLLDTTKMSESPT